MSFKTGFLCFISSLAIYLGLAIVERFTLGILLEGLICSFVLRLILVLVFLVLLNPLITYAITERLPLKPTGLKKESA